MSETTATLGLKFADRTFRFVCLTSLEDGPQLIAAGAGLIPFDAKHRGQMRSVGADRLIDGLERSLDRMEVERGGVVVVLDGRSVIRAVFPVNSSLVEEPDALLDRARWELNRRRRDREPEEELHVEYTIRGRLNGQHVVDAWGSYPGTLASYDRIVQGVGCHVMCWDCDSWSVMRLFQRYVPEEEREGLSAVVHLEAESMEVGLICSAGSVFRTSPQADSPGPFRRAWDPDDSEEVAREIGWWIQQLRDRWLPGARQAPTEVKRLFFTGSIDEPDRLLAALTRVLPMRVEGMDLLSILSIHASVANSPMIQGNLGAFALSTGGALARLPQ